ncbi:MAG: DNA-protecting protein DprA, partial [Gemmatimonadetes bacterium]|nr:DNA-protecting protein DprA [Gemmatimonadota bacterium]
LPDEPALPHHFPKRNRIIAALSRAIIVVEAGTRSGALITVDHGLDLGRDILAVPGSVENPQAAGSNALLGEGARIVADPGRVLEDLEGLGWDLDAVGGSRAVSASRFDQVPDELRSIWAVLSETPRSPEEVAREASIRLPEALAGLSALELGGWAWQRPGMLFQRR